MRPGVTKKASGGVFVFGSRHRAGNGRPGELAERRPEGEDGLSARATRGSALAIDAAGNEDFDRIFREERSAVHRHLVFLTGDRSLAEDLTQETFGRLYSRPPAEGLRNPRAWLLTTASRLAYNHARGEIRRRERETRVGETVLADVDAVLDVRRALDALQPRDRMMLLLRHSGFSYAEIAEATDLAPGSVGTVLARAQRRFREIYESRMERE